MIISLRIANAMTGDIYLDLVDNWYEKNYWQLKYAAPGALGANYGPYTYYPNSRKASLWDGAGSVLVQIFELDYPPYTGYGPASGGAYHYTTGKRMRAGWYRWFTN